MSDESNSICYTCKKESGFRLVTQNYRPIITENALFYIGEKIIIYNLVKINPSKPVWTNQYGIDVLLKNAVLLGGNGLNG